MNRLFTRHTLVAVVGATLAATGFVALSTSRAEAACTTTLVAHVRAGEAALDRSANGRSPAADAALVRNVDLASTEIGSCRNTMLQRRYYELAAWKAAFTLAAGGIDGPTSRVVARRLRDDLAILYRTGGATHEPERYALLKAAARRAYERNGLAFCSPDLTLRDCALAARLARPHVAVRTPSGPSCTLPDADATIVAAEQPYYPDIARVTGASGTSKIRLTVGPDGRVSDTSVYASSGNRWLDRAAIAAAEASTYRAARHHCRAVAATYIFQADFAP